MRIPSAALAAVVGLSLISPAIAKPLCYTPQDVNAMQVRQLHYELMVASLKCHTEEADFRGKWSSWVSRFGGTMNDNAQQLRAMFARMGKGSAAMDRYSTQLSNDASIRSQHIEDYCETQGKLYDQVLSLKPHEMESWAAHNVDKPYSAVSCSAPAKAPAVKEAKAQAPAAKAPAPTKTSGKEAAKAKKAESKG